MKPVILGVYIFTELKRIFILQQSECVVCICIIHTRVLSVHFTICVMRVVNDICHKWIHNVLVFCISHNT